MPLMTLEDENKKLKRLLVDLCSAMLHLSTSWERSGDA